MFRILLRIDFILELLVTSLDSPDKSEDYLQCKSEITLVESCAAFDEESLLKLNVRSNEQSFLEILNRMKDGNCSDEDLVILNETWGSVVNFNWRRIFHEEL